MSVFQAWLSSKDLKIRFDSQFCRMNCQIFSWPLSSGARGSRVRRQAILDAAEFVGNEIAVKIQDPDGPMGITSYLKQVAREHSVACSLALYRSNRNQRKRSIFVLKSRLSLRKSIRPTWMTRPLSILARIIAALEHCGRDGVLPKSEQFRPIPR
jgi:hypothetical protein